MNLEWEGVMHPSYGWVCWHLESGESFPGFLSNPGHFQPPLLPMKAAPPSKSFRCIIIFFLLFYLKANTIKNTPHSCFFTSMKSKHRETLPRNEAPDLFKGKYPILRIPQDFEGGTLSVLESAKSGRTATVPASLPYPAPAAP